jgi:hypothetical protein
MLDPIPDVVTPRTDRYGVELDWWDRDCERSYRSAATARVPHLPASLCSAPAGAVVVPHIMLVHAETPSNLLRNLAALLGALEHPLVLSGQAPLDLGPKAMVGVWAAARFAAAPQVLLDLARSRHMPVRKALAEAAGLPDPIAALLAQDPNPTVRAAIQGNSGIGVEWQVLATLSG